MGRHTGNKPYQCSYCDIVYSMKSKLKMHMRTHTGKKPYQCNQCDKAFLTNSNHVRHMRLHKRDKPYQCSHCGKSFFLIILLFNMRKYTRTREKPYQYKQSEKD